MKKSRLVGLMKHHYKKLPVAMKMWMQFNVMPRTRSINRRQEVRKGEKKIKEGKHKEEREEILRRRDIIINFLDPCKLSDNESQNYFIVTLKHGMVRYGTVISTVS